MSNEKQHEGELLREYLTKKTVILRALCRKMGKAATYLHHVFKKEKLSRADIQIIGAGLEVDLVDELNLLATPSDMVEEPSTPYQRSEDNTERITIDLKNGKITSLKRHTPDSENAQELRLKRLEDVIMDLQKEILLTRK